jgi:hypothetical protein
MLDLAKNDPTKQAEIGYEMPVVLPDGTSSDATITVRGAFSPKVKAFQRKVFQQFELKKQQAKRRGKDVEDMTLEEADEFSAEGAAIRIISWKGIQENGVDVVFSLDEAIRILKAYEWIKPQVMEASDNIFNFSKS